MIMYMIKPTYMPGVHLILILRILPVGTFFIMPKLPVYHLQQPVQSYLSVNYRIWRAEPTVSLVVGLSFGEVLVRYEEVKVIISQEASVRMQMSFILFFMYIEPSAIDGILFFEADSDRRSAFSSFCLQPYSCFIFSLWNFTACFSISFLFWMFRMQSLKSSPGTMFSQLNCPVWVSSVRWAFFRYSICFSSAALAVFSTMFSMVFKPITLSFDRIIGVESIDLFFKLLGEWQIGLISPYVSSPLQNLFLILECFRLERDVSTGRIMIVLQSSFLFLLPSSNPFSNSINPCLSSSATIRQFSNFLIDILMTVLKLLATATPLIFTLSPLKAQ